MKKYIAPNARCIILELEAMIAESHISAHDEYGDNSYFSNRRDDTPKNSIWDN